MAVCKTKTVNLQFLDRPEIVTLALVDSCEDLWRLAARKIIGVKPSALEIFGLKSVENSTWLSPSDAVPLNQAWTIYFLDIKAKILKIIPMRSIFIKRKIGKIAKTILQSF